ncbi:Putative transcription initiation factor TFIID subunit 12 domain, histone-fold [Septoria linicola]|uniref:Transcription initiation factor TFIID subunit 12 domain, histone-fold n=1 Tax=Septoria linicola TaxID=215465 RepID=A0A9Q9AZU3_9PEZI|nr:putative transcription initiation factor TFIID subunit 12 domain, histone-fold [Septoria linicola]USW56258.1 Putative transcription initiation factor TFIID subunit 12 domain, histone-fold [Septoria linicola]
MAQAPSSGNPPMIRPEQIDHLPFLNGDAKNQYKQGLTNLWTQYNSSPVDSDARKDAETKIKTASSRLMAQLANRNRPTSAQGQPGQPAQTQQQQQQRPPQQGGQPQQMAAQAQGQQQQSGQQAGQMNQQQAAQAQAQAAARARQQGQGAQTGNAGGGGQQLQPLMPKSQEELDSVVLGIPPEQHQAWRSQAHQILLKRDQILNQARGLQTSISRFTQAGQPVPEQARRQFEQAKGAVSQVNQNWTQMKARGEGRTDAAQQARPATQQGPPNSVPQQQQQQQQTDAKPANGSPSPPQNGFQQNQQPGATQNQQNTQQPQAPNQQQQTPQSASQPQQQQNFSQQNNMPPQLQQQRPPPINTNMPNQGQQQGPPQNQMPNSATQNAGRPQPLSHQAAMASAAETYRQNQPQQQPGPQPPQMPNGLPFNTQQNNTSQQSTPTYPNLQTTQTSSANTKFPIPKTLQLGPQTQNPVAGPPARPTYNNSGMMQQPGIQRPPPFTLEGEGDRVLSKRKLDELVRQVTGSAPAASDSESSNVLSPEVEEVMLELADDFTDNVLGDACKLAKMRPNQTLDIRDIQIVLERKYGIRIPGYSLEEARTVKKFQPAAAWQNKMQAVQAAKVMGGRDP